MIKTFILASALSLFMAGPAAGAAVTPANTAYPIVTLNGIDYEVTLVRGPWIEVMHQVTSTPWYGDGINVAMRAANAFADDGFVVGNPVLFAYWQGGANNGGGLSVFEIGGDAEHNGVEQIYYPPSVLESLELYAVLAPVTAVPLPAAGWLFMSALIGLMGKKRLSRRSVH